MRPKMRSQRNDFLGFFSTDDCSSDKSVTVFCNQSQINVQSAFIPQFLDVNFC